MTDSEESKRAHQSHVAMVRIVREAIADGRIGGPDGLVEGMSPDRYCIECKRRGETTRMVYDRLQALTPRP